MPVSGISLSGSEPSLATLIQKISISILVIGDNLSNRFGTFRVDTYSLWLVLKTSEVVARLRTRYNTLNIRAIKGGM